MPRPSATPSVALEASIATLQHAAATPFAHILPTSSLLNSVFPYQVERHTRESNFYPAEKVKTFLMETKLPDARPLINVCDRFDMVADLTNYLNGNNMLRFIDGYVQRVNPANTPTVVGALLDLEAPDEFINNLILSVGVAWGGCCGGSGASGAGGGAVLPCMVMVVFVVVVVEAVAGVVDHVLSARRGGYVQQVLDAPRQLLCSRYCWFTGFERLLRCGACSCQSMVLQTLLETAAACTAG